MPIYISSVLLRNHLRQPQNKQWQVPNNRVVNQIVDKLISDTKKGATVYTDDARCCVDLDRTYEAVNHSVKKSAKKMFHASGLDSFWILLKRTCHGAFHHFIDKHFGRYVNEFSGSFNFHELDTDNIFRGIFHNMDTKRLRFPELMEIWS